MLRFKPYGAWMRDFYARLLLQAPMSLGRQEVVAVLWALASLHAAPDAQVLSKLVNVSAWHRSRFEVCIDAMLTLLR